MQNSFEKNYLKEVVLDDNIFENIIKKASKVDLIYLSFNLSLSVKMINKLFSFKIDNVNINLLRNSLCPNSKIEEFLKLNDKIYNIAIEHNPSFGTQY